MAVVSMNYLLEAGVQFGHQKRRWNPKMREYIYTTRDDIYIIDLQKTAKKMEEAYEAVKQIAQNGGMFLFVGTKKQAQEAAEESATRTNMYFVNERWLGGTLTNFKTIRSRIKRMDDIENMEKDGTFDVLPKKEVIGLKKKFAKLYRNLRGIRSMTKLPDALIIVDPKKEENAIKEARILGIPVFGVVDTNCDPDMVDYVIPGNDDAVRSVKLMIGVLANAIAEVNGNEMIDYLTDDDKNKKSSDKEEGAPKKEERRVVKKEEKEHSEPKKEVAPVAEPVKEEKADYSKMTVAELKAMAKEKEIAGYTTMKKAELIEALEK